MKKYKPAYKSKNKIPKRYFTGLNTKENNLMTKEILQRPQSLEYWSADKAYSKRLKLENKSINKSKYTIQYIKKYGKENTTSLDKISKATKISLDILKKIYKRGIGAWTSGHRPGVYPAQWAMARVYSFVMGGKTRKTADKDLWEQHMKRRRNPIDDRYINLLILAYDDGDPYWLSDAITYKKQGYTCDDCGENFEQCYCEYCLDCDFRRCLCDLGLTFANAFSTKTAKIKESTKNKIREEVLKIVNKELDKYQLAYFNSQIKK